MKYYLWTIGCQMNFADSRQAADELTHLGYRETGRPQDADLILLNTCVVRQSAEDKVTGRLTSLQGLKRRRPELKLALMGCYVNEIPALQHRYPWVDAFIKPSDVSAVVELARQPAPGIVRHSPESRIQIRESKVAVGVPISQGCDHLCTYCIVRLRRGPEVSRPMAEIVTKVRGLADRGVKEVTLLGQNVDSYGRDLPALASPPRAGGTEGGQVPDLADREVKEVTPLGQNVDSYGPDLPALASPPRAGGTEGGKVPDLADLLLAVHEVAGLERIRFLTSHPSDMTDRLIETVARLPRVCEHMEIPVQSGDDAVLRRMGRGYTVAEYRALVDRTRAAMPGVGLATDVIVGFPGETKAQFEATYQLLEDLRFDMVHVAPYSPRPDTPASGLPDDVPPEEKERRRRTVDDLQERIVGEINGQILGQRIEVLVEERHKGKWRGRTRTNKLVFFDTDDRDWTGQLVQVLITRTGAWSMQGEVEGA